MTNETAVDIAQQQLTAAIARHAEVCRVQAALKIELPKAVADIEAARENLRRAKQPGVEIRSHEAARAELKAQIDAALAAGQAL